VYKVKSLVAGLKPR